MESLGEDGKGELDAVDGVLDGVRGDDEGGEDVHDDDEAVSAAKHVEHGWLVHHRVDPPQDLGRSASACPLRSLLTALLSAACSAVLRACTPSLSGRTPGCVSRNMSMRRRRRFT